MIQFQELLQARLGAYISDSDEHSDNHIVTINLVDDKEVEYLSDSKKNITYVFIITNLRNIKLINVFLRFEKL